MNLFIKRKNLFQKVWSSELTPNGKRNGKLIPKMGGIYPKN